MKIIHPSGSAYDLSAGTVLQFTRSNPFFSEIGEVSLPITLPATPHNRKLIGFSNHPNRSSRIDELSVVIDLGVTQMKARQIIHGSDDKGISTTFYLNDGSVFAKVGTTTVSEVFDSEVLHFGSVGAAVSFLEGIVEGKNNGVADERMSLFTVRVKGWTDDSYRYLNVPHAGSYVLKGRDPITVDISGKKVDLPAGYGITPFIKCRYALQVVAHYFGYELAPSFLDDEPFSGMVFLNNNNDTILDGNIHLKHLLPDITVKEFLNVFRTRFCCEFYPDELDSVLHILKFNDVMAERAVDLTAFMSSDLTMEYPDFCAIELKAEKIDSDTSDSTYTLPDLFRKGMNRIPVSDVWPDRGLVPGVANPFFYYPPTGKIYQIAVQGMKELVVECGDCNSTFPNSTILPSKEIAITGKLPAMIGNIAVGGQFDTYDGTIYVGQARSLKSSIIFSDNTQESSADAELPAMLAFTDSLLSGHIVDSPTPWLSHDQSLLPNGPTGLYARFWALKDCLYRNALIKVSCKMHLTDIQKMQLKPYQKIMIGSAQYLLDQLSYTIGDVQSLCTCKLLTTGTLSPEVEVESQIFADTPAYRWVMTVTDAISGYDGPTTFYQYLDPVDTIYFRPATESDYKAYPSGGDAFYESRTYSAQWYRSVAGPASGYLSGTRTVAFQVSRT